ncbi:hypothetical protein ACFVWZ_27670 [Streptomyces sp. NPDC058200]|uniref:hypothetical protein n=1 Tax=Streptomyces sp. NPDC058200 TaxID=3346378 RepID=UPI0036E77674
MPSTSFSIWHLKMTAEDFARGAGVWLGVLREQQPAEYAALMRDDVRGWSEKQTGVLSYLS